MKTRYQEDDNRMIIKSIALISFILIIAAAPSSRGQEISPALQRKIFVPLNKVDPTQGERAEYLKKGQTALAAGESRQARTFFNLALLLNIKDVDANMALGQLLYEAKQYIQAREHFLKVLEENPDHLKALMNMGKISFTLFKRTEAFEYFQEVAELNPGNPEATKYINYILGENQVKGGLPEQYYTIPYSEAVTRSELAALVYFRTDKLKALKTPPQPQIITDIGESWAKKYIREVIKYKIMDIYPDHSFQPQSTINRGEFAQVIMNLVKGLHLYEIYLESTPHKALTYSDIDPYNNYYDAVRLVSDLEIIVPGQDMKFGLDGAMSGKQALEYFDLFDRAARRLRADR